MKVKEAKRNGYYVEASDGSHRIHSQYDPIKEARRLLPDEPTASSKYVVLGAGLGYVLNSLSNLDPDADVLVAEPQPELLSKGQSRDIWTPDAFQRFQVIGPEEPDLFQSLGQFFSLRDTNDVEVVRWPQYHDQYPEFFRDILDKTARLQELHRESIKVLKLEGPTWIKHMRQNLRYLRKHHVPAFTKTRDPVAFVSAGPSLDYQIDWLREHQSSLHVLIGNTAGPIIEHYDDVKPDAHVYIDANDPLLDDLRQSRVNHLIASPFVDPEILELYRGSLSFLAVQTPLTEWMASADFLPTVQAGGAISATVLSWLSDTPSETIYLLGCDMEVRFGRYYAQGTARESIEAVQSLNRFRTLPQWHLVEKPMSQSGQTSLTAERDWFKERSKTMDRLRVPSHPPDWWEGPVGRTPEKTIAGDFELAQPDTEIVDDWIDTQHGHLDNVIHGKPAPDSWTTFKYWVEKVMPDPEQELSAWESMFDQLR